MLYICIEDKDEAGIISYSFLRKGYIICCPNKFKHANPRLNESVGWRGLQ